MDLRVDDFVGEDELVRRMEGRIKRGALVHDAAARHEMSSCMGHRMGKQQAYPKAHMSDLASYCRPSQISGEK